MAPRGDLSIFPGRRAQEAMCAQKVIQDYAMKYSARDESSLLNIQLRWLFCPYNYFCDYY